MSQECARVGREILTPLVLRYRPAEIDPEGMDRQARALEFAFSRMTIFVTQSLPATYAWNGSGEVPEATAGRILDEYRHACAQLAARGESEAEQLRQSLGRALNHLLCELVRKSRLASRAEPENMRRAAVAPALEALLVETGLSRCGAEYDGARSDCEDGFTFGSPEGLD